MESEVGMVTVKGKPAGDFQMGFAALFGIEIPITGRRPVSKNSIVVISPRVPADGHPVDYKRITRCYIYYR